MTPLTTLPIAMPDPERDAEIARKNRKLGLILAAVIGGAVGVSYLTRFVLWHVVFK